MAVDELEPLDALDAEDDEDADVSVAAVEGRSVAATSGDATTLADFAWGEPIKRLLTFEMAAVAGELWAEELELLDLLSGVVSEDAAFSLRKGRALSGLVGVSAGLTKEAMAIVPVLAPPLLSLP